MTDRYAHIEYKPAETAHWVVGDPELVAIQKEPVQSYHLQPKPTTVTVPSRSKHIPKSYSLPSSFRKPYHLQPETTEVSKPEISHQRSKPKRLKRQQTLPYWTAGNEAPTSSPDGQSPVDDDTDGASRDREGSSQIPIESLSSGAVVHTVAFSGDESQPPRVPILQFSLQHDSGDNTLTVHLIQAEHLPVKDIGGASDPFVKLSLESNACECFESKVIRRTLNPRFNQHFKFTNLPSKIHLEKLVFEIYDYDRMSINDFIGEVRVLLRKELLNGDTITMRVDELARELRV